MQLGEFTNRYEAETPEKAESKHDKIAGKLCTRTCILMMLLCNAFNWLTDQTLIDKKHLHHVQNM